MPQHNNALKAQHESRIQLALQAYTSNQFRSLRSAARAFNVKHHTLCERAKGIKFRPELRANCQKLTYTEEQTIVRYILDLHSRGFAPHLCEVSDMADKLLAVRGGEPVGKRWAERLVSRTDELKMAFKRAKDSQRSIQEDPGVIGAWFELVEETKAQHGVHDDDVHNFDESSFQMGIASSLKVVTGSDRRIRPGMIQPGDREWVTVIQGICAAGYAIPPFIIYKGTVHISAWYEGVDIPSDWKISVSENGLTNNELGLEWLKHFDAHTKARQVGRYRLLILDSHESHLSQHFKDYCLENEILTLCMPPHSSHILQPLDVVCLSPLKRKYSENIRGLACGRFFHINKEGFLPAFRDAFLDVFNAKNCQRAFEATGIVPIDAQTVLSRLGGPSVTPPLPEIPAATWESRTPSNTHEFESQPEPVRASFTRSPITTQQGFAQFAKGAELMLHQNKLMSARITELEEQLETTTKRKPRKRKRAQHGSTMEYGSASAQVASEAPVATQRPKKNGVAGSQEGVQPAQRRCGNCKGIGHNIRTCREDAEDIYEHSEGI